MDSQAQVVGLKYSICRSFLRTIRQDRAAGGNKLRKFCGKGIAIVPVLLLFEGRGYNKAMSFSHDIKLFIKRHDTMMSEAIQID